MNVTKLPASHLTSAEASGPAPCLGQILVVSLTDFILHRLCTRNPEAPQTETVHQDTLQSATDRSHLHDAYSSTCDVSVCMPYAVAKSVNTA